MIGQTLGHYRITATLGGPATRATSDPVEVSKPV